MIGWFLLFLLWIVLSNGFLLLALAAMKEAYEMYIQDQGCKCPNNEDMRPYIHESTYEIVRGLFGQD